MDSKLVRIAPRLALVVLVASSAAARADGRPPAAGEASTETGAAWGTEIPTRPGRWFGEVGGALGLMSGETATAACAAFHCYPLVPQVTLRVGRMLDRSTGIVLEASARAGGNGMNRGPVMSIVETSGLIGVRHWTQPRIYVQGAAGVGNLMLELDGRSDSLAWGATVMGSLAFAAVGNRRFGIDAGVDAYVTAYPGLGETSLALLLSLKLAAH